MLARIVRWSLERPRLIAWVCLGFLIWAALAARDTPIDLLPDLAPAETTVQTEAPGLAADQVENLVTQPIENVLIGATDVADVRAQSVQGLSIVTVRFAAGADPHVARQAIAERLSAIAGSLPDGVSPPRVAPLTSWGSGVLQIGFSSAKLDPMALRDLIEWTVRPRLLAAGGVASVAVYGGQVRRIEVRARPGDLSDSDLGFLDILNATKRATSVVGAGFIDTDSQRVLIEPHGQTLTADDVGAGQIQTAGNAPVRINDVADVVEAPAPAFGDALIMGRPGILVDVAKQYGANTLKTTADVETVLATLRPSLAAQGVEMRTDLDRPASFAAAAVRGIAWDVGIGAALIAIVLFLFLRDPRPTLISLVTIPLSLLAGVLALKAIGWSLNAMTLGGLALGMGAVIDDGVIGVESVMARLRDAEARHASRLDAVLAASLEVRAPVVYASLAGIVVMAPILALPGAEGALLTPLAGAFIAVSAAALLVAVVVTPALCLIFLGHVRPSPHPKLMQSVHKAHAAGLVRLCARPWVVVILAAALVFLAIGSLAFTRSEFLPSVYDGELVAQSIGPPATAISVTRDYGERIAGMLLRLNGVRAVSQRIGRDPTGADSWGPERTALHIALAPGLDAAGQRAVRDEVRETLRSLPGVATTLSSRFDAAQEASMPEAPVEVALSGADLDDLDTAARRVADALRTLPGAGAIGSSSGARAPVVRVDINFQRLALFGLSSADVLDTIQAAFAGERVARIYERGRVVDLAVSAQDSLRQDPEGVGNLLLRSTSGISVPLKAVANVYLTDDHAAIDDVGGLRREVVTASPEDPARFIDQARRAVARVSLPPGVILEWAGGARNGKAARDNLILDYALAALSIFALLSIAFDARTSALILLSTLFALAGGAVAVAWLGGVLSVGAMVGFIALFSLSIRSAILLFSRLEDLVLERRELWSPATVIGAARERLTPVLMTTLMVALGVVALAVQAGDAGREILGPMAIVILGGLFTGALGILFLLPPMILALWRPAFARRARHHRSADTHA